MGAGSIYLRWEFFLRKIGNTCPVQLTVELRDGRPAKKDIQGSGCAGCCSNCKLHADINSFRSSGFS